MCSGKIDIKQGGMGSDYTVKARCSTDIRMPGLNGLDLLGKIREENLNTKVVLVSGFAEFEYARIAIRDGAFEYLVKPVSKDQLSDCMKRLSKE